MVRNAHSLLHYLKRPLELLSERALRDVHRRIHEAEKCLHAAEKRLQEAESRLVALENRALHLRRYALEEVTEYLRHAQLAGDYCEFGVAQGHTFASACMLMGTRFPAMDFVAFDSFEGLPAPSGVDAESGYSSGFEANQFAYSEDSFRQFLQANGIDLGRVRIYKGWFDDALSERAPATLQQDKIAVAWVDCDLYESAVPVLNFLTPRLQIGSVLVFDDWGCYRNLPNYGEQRACAEWLAAYPQLRLAPLLSYGWMGRVFTVTAC